MAPCNMAKTESPTLRELSTAERTVGWVMTLVSGLGNVQDQAGMPQDLEPQALTQTQSSV